MASIIKLKRSTSAGVVPSSSSLAAGELAINLADKKLFSSSDGTDIITISGDQYNLSSSGNSSFGVINLSVDNDALSNDSIEITGDGAVTTERVANGAIVIRANPSSIYQSFTTDSGGAVPNEGDARLLGGTGIDTAGSGNTVTFNITNLGVNTAQLADGAVTSAKIASGTITVNAIATGAITSDKILNGTIATVDLADGAVTGAKLASGTIAANAIATGAVTSDKILNGTIATADLADGSVTGAKLATGTVAANAIGSLAVTTAKIADGAVTGAKLASATIAANAIATGAVTSDKILNGTIATVDLADGAVTAAKIANKGLGGNTITDFAITSVKLANKTITANSIADGVITSTQMSAGAVTTNAIATDAVTNAKILNDHVAIAANSGTTTDIALGETFNIVSGTATGITTSRSANTIVISGVNASTTVKGIAKFDSDDFSVATGTVSLADAATGAVLSISGTANEIETSRTNGTVTLGLPNDVTIASDLTLGGGVFATGNAEIGGTLQVTGDATIDGNLTVEGALTYISSSTVNIDDSQLKLSANNSADTVDSGVYALYIESATSKYAGYFRDATDGVFKFYNGIQVEPGLTVDPTATGYGLAQVDAIIDGGTFS